MAHFKASNAALCLMLFTIPTIFACNKVEEYQLAPVEGVLKLDGVPVSGVLIRFYPVSTGGQINVGPKSSATTDEDGRFVMRTMKRNPEVGAVIGNHRVMFDDRLSQDDAAKILWKVPRHYEKGLDFMVPAEGDTKVVLDLTSKKRK
ncbi:transthyretin-like family protein [Calycomorphotria hydatis]|uniref:Carboxypeptidase regulatory-like domain-containing protein n=1 Tax=Calycomorphotria hydatis TaxID=2528027 RepID=A0A517TEC1_9PLAN|nr:hypothetical protein [Calycomorphotria hydatis]QDT66712.1 hypothetical protein V22_39830 [Calycomorphotria hydatis]